MPQDPARPRATAIITTTVRASIPIVATAGTPITITVRASIPIMATIMDMADTEAIIPIMST